MRRWILLLLLLPACRASQLRPQTARRQTAEERFFDWTELQFAPETHAERRARMLGLLASRVVSSIAPSLRELHAVSSAMHNPAATPLTARPMLLL